MSRQQQEQLGLQATGEVYKQMPVLAAENEAELAGVMAHEMSHVYMQHSAKQAGKASLAQGLLGVLGAVLPGTPAGNIARLGIQIGAGTIFMRYSRKDEAQADAVGAIIMYKAGYNPKALAEFFQKLESQGGGSGPQFLSDHPNPGNRVAAVDKEIQNWPSKNYLPSSSEFARARQDAGSVKAYTAQQISDGAKQGLWSRQNQQNGAVPSNLPQGGNGGGSRRSGRNLSNISYREISPSGNFNQYRHNAFIIQYPSNWQATGDQNSGVTIAPPAGVDQGQIAYGVIIGGAQDPNASNLDQAMQDLVQNLEQSNPGLQSSGRIQDIEVNGLRGRAINLRGTSPIQQNGQSLPERDWLIGLPRPEGGLLYIVFVAPENQFSQLSSTYQAMLNSLQIR